MTLKPIFAALLCCLLLSCTGETKALNIRDILAQYDIDPDHAAMMIVRLDDGRTWSHGGARLDQRYVAASTSKIPHTFIALHEGFVTSADTQFEWDGRVRGLEAWNQDQTIATAYARSAVWVYQHIARSLGSETMTAGLRMMNYGNQDTGSPDDVTTYWLTGPLKISAKEQIAFLTQLYREAFPMNAETYRVGKAIMRAGRDDNRHAKTGWYFSEDETDIGWYVGWQPLPRAGDSDASIYLFAFNMDILDRDLDPPKRVLVIDSVLETLQSISD
jgi:beta-lactamase class D